MQFVEEIKKLKSKLNWLKFLCMLTIIGGMYGLSILKWGSQIPNYITFIIIVASALTILQINYFFKEYLNYQIELLTSELLSNNPDQIATAESNFDKETNSNYTNKQFLRIRGSDEKGPAFDTETKKFSPENVRVDALTNSDYDDLESDNTDGEILISKADEIYSEVAESRWKESESKDNDLIEAGVDNLGDLIKTGWFEKNKKKGAVQDLYKKK